MLDLLSIILLSLYVVVMIVVVIMIIVHHTQQKAESAKLRAHIARLKEKNQ